MKSKAALVSIFLMLVGISLIVPVIPAASAADGAPSGFQEITEVEFIGLESTKKDAALDLLPRSLPTQMTDEEVREYSRRIKNLGLFDSIQVSVEGTHLKVQLRHKSTLSPIVSFSSGKTFEDSSATLGVIEHDFLGSASKVGAKASYAERGVNFSIWLDQHPYNANKWAKEYEAYRYSSGFRFSDTTSTWSRNRLGGFLEWLSPFHYGGRIRYEFQVSTYYENFTSQTGVISPSDGLYLGALFEIIYDAYRWDDLTPSGYRWTLELRPGGLTRGTFRGETRLKLLAATPLGDKSALYFNASAAAVNSGDVNHSILIGSQQGVRGLPDSFYRSSIANFLNIEFRHAFQIFNRIYLQPMLFTDVAAFQAMNSGGQVTDWTTALSAGTGLRIVPTGLTDLLFRMDAAWLLLPTRGWLVQFGISQYF